jgi:hypothetical protein
MLLFCSGSTALKQAVKQKNESMVRLLLEHGADVNAKTIDVDSL